MLTRSFRRLMARICIAALLFSQLAVAAYACEGWPGQADSGMHAQAQAMPAAHHADMPAHDGCAMDPVNDGAPAEPVYPNLCQEHCQAGDRSVQGTLQVAAAAVAVLPILRIEPLQFSSSSGQLVLPVLLARSTAPPLSVRFSVFRI